jgi:hypothetical protein
MLNILDSRDNSRLTDATDRDFGHGGFASGRWIFEFRRSILNFSIRNGLISLSRFAPKNRFIDLSRPSSPFQLRRFALAQGTKTLSTNHSALDCSEARQIHPGESPE